MNKYLSFSCSSFQFMLPVQQIVELYNAEASPELLSSVLVGDQDRVYWRGNLSCLMDVNDLLSIDADDNHQCFIVCKGKDNDKCYFILRVGRIHELHDVDAQSFKNIELQNVDMHNLSHSVCILPGHEKLFYLMREFEELFLQRTGMAI